MDKIDPLVDFRPSPPAAGRSGRMPCSGVVKTFAALRITSIGDAAGMVSPRTAGGIHTALKHKLATGHATEEFPTDKSADSRISAKRCLRSLFHHFQSDLVFNRSVGDRIIWPAASVVYFHREGVFNPKARL